jgi:ABC-2 type transport system ATP-binding protein
MSISVRQLTKTYGQQTVVNHVSFEAHPGKILGFLGPNGAGKTTTMKMISCYTPPTSGSAVVCGHDILVDALSVRQNIGYLPENNPLYEEMYVKEYLDFVANIHKVSNKSKRISDVIEQTGLGREQNKIIGTLSKGYRQRVGLAQAIFHDPKVLILDEPTSGLDMNQLQDIRSLIRDLGKEKTVVFSSHIMQEVEALCDRVVIINNGQLVADEDISSLRHRIKGSNTIYLTVAESTANLAMLSDIQHITKVNRSGNQWIIQTESNHDVRNAISKAIYEAGYTIIEMRLDQANVEDVFRKLTQN